jgi:hypothetical protein
VGVDGGEKEGFKGLDDGAKKGNGTVAGCEFGVFAGFGNGDDGGGFPNSRDFTGGEGEVEDESKVVNGNGAEVLEVDSAEIVGTKGSGGARLLDTIGHLSGRELGGPCQREPFGPATNFAVLVRGLVGSGASELAVKMVGDGRGVCKGLVKVDCLLALLLTLPVEGADNPQVVASPRTGVRGEHELAKTGGLGLVAKFVYVSVEGSKTGVCGVGRPESIPFLDQLSS